ncbi:MAG: hypothetical protein JJU11_08370 [Candidatus Sumerlaeia bacterium]|nr:hypothetical protein [Candidatus Sumerlaeia bacterium]
MFFYPAPSGLDRYTSVTPGVARGCHVVAPPGLAFRVQESLEAMISMRR